MKDLQYEHQSIFHCGGESNLILRTGMESQMFFFTGSSILQTLTHALIHVIDRKLCKLDNGDTPMMPPIAQDAPIKTGATCVMVAAMLEI